MPRLKVVIAGLSLFVFVAACDMDQVIPTNDNTIIDTAVVATVTALSTVPTETSPVVQPCPVDDADPTPPTLTGVEAFPSQIQAYLNQGGRLEELVRVMEANQLDPHEGLPYSRQDFTGDGLEDVVVSILNGDGRQIAPAGTLLFFVCREDQYQLVYTSPPSAELAAPFLRMAQDINGDGAPDMLTTRETCGAHTCSYQVDVLTWEEDSLQSIFPDLTTDIPLSVVDLEGPLGNGSYDVVVTGTGIASVGAGPYRRFSKVWSYDRESGQYQFSNSYVHDSTFRIHFVHDADQAFLDGELETALDLYARVINDDSLDDWVAEEEGARTLAAYAMYRRMLTFLQLGQVETARAELTLLRGTFLPDTPGYPYLDLAQTLWDEYQATGDLDAACHTTQGYAQTHSQTILDSLYYGYANKTYVAADVCPTRD